MYPKSAGPRYTVAMAANCATVFIAIIFATPLRIMLVRLRRKLDEGMVVEESEEVDHDGIPVDAA